MPVPAVYRRSFQPKLPAVFDTGGRVQTVSMQSPTSLGLVGGIVLLALLGIALTVAASAVIAIPLFLVGLVAFLLWRGKQRAGDTAMQREVSRVPSTEEAAADPAGDSGVADVARSSSGTRAT
jgi:cbb3-type cytochrome oxidase subunit 3